MPLPHRSLTSHPMDGRMAAPTARAEGADVAAVAARRAARARLLTSRQYAVRTAPPSAIHAPDA